MMAAVVAALKAGQTGRPTGVTEDKQDARIFFKYLKKLNAVLIDKK